MSDDLLLSLLWSVPLAGSLLTLCFPKRAEGAIKWFALAVTVAVFALTIVAFAYYTGNDSAKGDLRARAAANTLKVVEGGALAAVDSPGDLVTRSSWIPYFNIQYYLGIDGISLSLLLLTGLVVVLACLASWRIEKNVKGYFSLFLLLTASMVGVFLSLDLFLFYVFFELMLLPMYFLIAVWGGEQREYAAIKFLLYTLFGSVFILLAILVLYFGGTPPEYSFDAVKLAEIASTTGAFSEYQQKAIFALFLIGFLVKLPSFPFHTWLPDAHVQAPTPISMILAGVLLKIGGYGLIRLAWPLAPLGAQALAPLVAGLGVFSIIYGALAAMAQTDFKKLVAYSSVSHMGYITLGLASMNLIGGGRYYAYGVNGAMYMMIAHGITSTGMFFLVGVIYERTHTRDLNKLGGLANIMPVYAAISYILFFGSMGLPGLCGFVAEAFVILAAFNYNKTLAILAAAAVILTAGYILWTIQRIFLGKSEQWKGLPDMSIRELIIAAPLVVLTVVLGVYPQSILGWMEPSVGEMVTTVTKANNAAVPAAKVAVLDDPR